MSNAVFGKRIEDVRKHRDYLVSEPNYHTTNLFSDNVFTIKMDRENSKSTLKQRSFR